MLGAVWGSAVCGVLLKLWFIGLPRWISTVFYLLPGWIAVAPLALLLHSLPPSFWPCCLAVGCSTL
jgi:hemolysin III